MEEDADPDLLLLRRGFVWWIRTGPRRVLRVMREHGLLAHQRRGSPRGGRAHDGTITTERVDQMWGTDMTAVATPAFVRAPEGNVRHGA